MKWVIGEHLSLLNSAFDKLLKDTFTDYWEDNILTCVEELSANSANAKSGWDFMKSVATEDRMTSRGFMNAPDKMDLWVNLIINTNHFFAISQEFIERRGQCNRVNPVYKDNYQYFSDAMEAFDSYEGWEYYIHRYLINDYGQFSDQRVEPMECYMIDTKYRKGLMARGNDAIVYFFKDLMECMANQLNEENPYEEHYGMRLWINDLFQRFELYKLDNNIDPKIYSNVGAFEKALLAKFEINIRQIGRNYEGHKVSLSENTSKKYTPKVCKDRRGKAIVLEEEFFNAITQIIKHKDICDDDTIWETAEEEKKTRLDLDTIFPRTRDFNFMEDSDEGGTIHPLDM